MHLATMNASEFAANPVCHVGFWRASLKPNHENHWTHQVQAEAEYFEFVNSAHSDLAM
jgi:hypothetical protein